MPSKFGNMSNILSGNSETDTESDYPRAKAPSKPRTVAETREAKFGPGRRISDTEHAYKPKQPSQASPRRSTRSTSKAAGPAPATAFGPTPPLPTSSMPSNISPGKRGRVPAPQTTTRRVTRSQSPSKGKPKLIHDSPPPEDRMDPFPPQRAPMTVTDKPAVYNRYGEKVPAPVNLAQKLRQAENFLSDEGVENCADFEDKLIRLKAWLDKHHTLGDDISPEGDQETHERYRKVMWMIWVHQERIAEGSEQWFTRDQFPNSTSMIKPIKPTKHDQWRVTPDGVAIGGVPQHPKLQVMLAQDRERIPKERAARAKAVAAAKEAKEAAQARSSQTPAARPSPTKLSASAAARDAAKAEAFAAAEEAVQGRNSQTPAARRSPGKPSASAPLDPEAGEETQNQDEGVPELPYPEVWHRKEAARFPYGETPYMEQVMSDQITADLARGHVAKEEARDALKGGMLRPFWRAIGNIWPFTPEEGNSGDRFDPWELPEISDEAVYEADKTFNVLGRQVPTVAASPATKRRANAALRKPAPKRFRSGV
ncbi:hypothetical protein D6C99_00593 [Aureobasidium pullulans]|nr:hypothetical protein D6C99_00593 [Aureobasidium pullulans]